MKWRRFQVMSALPHKADIDARDCDVRFVPTRDMTTAHNLALHTEHRQRYTLKC